jgi:MbtH protein
MSDSSATVEFKVVQNHEEQYSIWPVWKPDPPGWKEEGTRGTKEECLKHIEEIWTDMRPLSLRQWMSEHVGETTQKKVEIPSLATDGTDYFHSECTAYDLVLTFLRSPTPQ